MQRHELRSIAISGRLELALVFAPAGGLCEFWIASETLVLALLLGDFEACAAAAAAGADGELHRAEERGS